MKSLKKSILILSNFSEYEVTAAPGQIIDYEVRDTKQHILSKKDDISRGKFSFTSEVFDVYELCFISKVPASKFSDFHRRQNFLILKTSSRRSWNASRSLGQYQERRRDKVLWRREYSKQINLGYFLLIQFLRWKSSWNFLTLFKIVGGKYWECFDSSSPRYHSI